MTGLVHPCLQSPLRRDVSADSIRHSMRSAGHAQQWPPAGSTAEVAPVDGEGREHGNNKRQLAAPLVLLMQSESFVLHEAVCESPPAKRVGVACSVALGVSASQVRSNSSKPKHGQPYLPPSPLRRGSADSASLRSAGRYQPPAGSSNGASDAEVAPVGAAAREHCNCQSPPAGSRKGAPAAKVAPVGREHSNCLLAAPLVVLMQSENFVLREAVCESPPSKRVAMAGSVALGVAASHVRSEPKHGQPYSPSPLGVGQCDMDIG